VLGGRPYEQLPGYLKAINVCLLPHRLNQYTHNMFPMKFFEYLAAGKPVVATALDAIKDFTDVHYRCGSPEEFENGITVALAEDHMQEEQKRFAVAQKYTWDSRIGSMSELIGKYQAEHSHAR